MPELRLEERGRRTLRPHLTLVEEPPQHQPSGDGRERNTGRARGEGGGAREVRVDGEERDLASRGVYRAPHRGDADLEVDGVEGGEGEGVELSPLLPTDRERGGDGRPLVERRPRGVDALTRRE